MLNQDRPATLRPESIINRRNPPNHRDPLVTKDFNKYPTLPFVANPSCQGTVMKSNGIIGLLAIGLTLMLSLPASATDLSEIYDLSVNNDPQLAAARASYKAIREQVPQARASLLPNLSASARTQDIRRTIVDFSINGDFNDNYNDHSWQAVLSQPIFRLESWFQFQQAKNLEARALAQFAAEQQQLIFRVSNSYLNILEADDRLSATNAERDAVKRQLEQVQQRFDVGLVAITDVLESTAAYDASTVRVIEAEGEQVISFETLLRLTGNPFRSIDGLSDDFPVEYPEPNDEEAWVKRALMGNYGLLAAREGVNAARRNLAASRSRYLPTVDAQLSFAESTSGATQNFLGGGGNADTVIEQRAAALIINVPIYSGGAIRSAAKQAGYQLEQAQQEFDFTQRRVVEDTRSQFTRINTDVARVKARLRGIESSQSALDATQTGYEVGTRNIVDVLLAQQRLYAAQFEYARVRYQYIRNTFELKQTVGSLSPDDIYSLNEFITPDEAVDRITPLTR